MAPYDRVLLTQKRVVVPKKLQNKAVTNAHRGHQSTAKTLGQLRQNWWLLLLRAIPGWCACSSFHLKAGVGLVVVCHIDWYKQFGWCYTKVWRVVWGGGMPLNSTYHRELQPTEKLCKLFNVTVITPHESWSDFSDQIMDIPYQIVFSDQIMHISYQIVSWYHLFLRG